MQNAICCVPVSPLRAEPSHKTEMVSELLFGELCSIIDNTTDQWVKIICKYDGYEGWCQSNHILRVDASIYNEPQGLTRKWITEIEYEGQPMQIPLGSSLPLFKKNRNSQKKNRVYYSGKTWNPLTAKKDKNSVKKLIYSFLNTPYLWGGKTVFGTDCSGFTQTIFRFLNIGLKRDAWQQATQGGLVGSLKESKFGDLAFFDNAGGRITHVGFLLNNRKIIHASGKVREDKINDKGIINIETGEKTHDLKLIRRYF
ncbi:MAG: C40 family peptidase [Bacteroidetes bacterium]|nr:C40 family peptidase [Bacteroidota bacterium]